MVIIDVGAEELRSLSLHKAKVKESMHIWGHWAGKDMQASHAVTRELWRKHQELEEATELLDANGDDAD